MHSLTSLTQEQRDYFSYTTMSQFIREEIQGMNSRQESGVQNKTEVVAECCLLVGSSWIVQIVFS